TPAETLFSERHRCLSQNHPPKTSAQGVRRANAALASGANPTRQAHQPEATGAAMDASCSRGACEGEQPKTGAAPGPRDAFFLRATTRYLCVSNECPVAGVEPGKNVRHQPGHKVHIINGLNNRFRVD